jgi:hypothetical protein
LEREKALEFGEKIISFGAECRFLQNVIIPLPVEMAYIAGKKCADASQYKLKCNGVISDKKGAK